jgi:hypothetical protein
MTEKMIKDGLIQNNADRRSKAVPFKLSGNCRWVRGHDLC